MAGRAQVNDALRDMVAFRQLNLIEPWPVRGPLDAIFCCNVLIYHTREGGRDILERFSRLLDCGGYLFLGHAESLPTDSGFHYCDRNTYRKLP